MNPFPPLPPVPVAVALPPVLVLVLELEEVEEELPPVAVDDPPVELAAEPLSMV